MQRTYNKIIYCEFYIIPFTISMKTAADFSDAVPTSTSTITSRARVPDGTANDSLSSDMILVYNAQQRYMSGRRSLESNVTSDKLNSMSKPWSVQNSEAVQRNSNPHRPREHINITTERSLGSYGIVALRNSSQDDVNTGRSLRTKYVDKVVSFSQEGQNEHYSDISKGMQVKNINYDEHMLPEHKTLDSSIISRTEVKDEDLRGTESKMKHTTASDDTKEGTRPEARNFRYGMNFERSDDDNIASETEFTYSVARYVSHEPIQDNTGIINSGGDDVAFDQEAQIYVPAQDGEVDVFPSNYKKQAGPLISSSGTPRALNRPFPPASSPYRLPGNRHIRPKPSRAPADVDSHGSPSSHYSSSSGSPYKSPSISYISKPTDSFGLESASYSSIASGPHRPPTLVYDSPPRELSIVSHGSPFRKPPSVPHSSPSRKPPSVSYESPPYKQFSTSYNSPSIDLYGSSNTLHYSPLSPSSGSVPYMISRPSDNAQPGDSYRSHTLTHGSKPPRSTSHGPPRQSHSSPLKKSPSLSYNLKPSDLYESPTSPYSFASHASRPPILENSPSHKSHRPSHGSPQKLPTPSQSSELYKSPISHHTLSHDTRPSISYSSTHGSHKLSQKSPRPSYESQPSDQYESPTSLYGLSTHDSRSPSISESSLSNTQYGPSYGSPSKKSHRPSYDSESSESFQPPSSSQSSPPHGSWSPSISDSSPSHRLPKPLLGLSSSDSYRSHIPSHDSPSSGLTVTSNSLPSNLIYEAPSDTFQEPLGSSEGGTGGSTHTFVKTDHHGNVKWGVRHSVGNQNAGSRP